MKRKRYALVGTGHRSVMYVDALAGEYQDVCELAAFCDLSPTRMAFHNKRIAEKFQHPAVPTYDATDFDRMIAERKPDVIIVTSADFTHHGYIIRAMELGCDAITEKPMTIDDEKARAIFDAIQRTGRKLRVAFNYRYAPPVTRLRELMMKDTVGQPLAVDFSWVLDTSHGADYFRRWHSQKEKSGGLLVHKATHHFDLINWWIGSRPKRVFAMGDLKFYGRKNAEARGETYSYERYTDHAEAGRDPFAFSLKSDEFYKGLYLDAEKESGYVRDRNVFGDHITIEDTMTVMAKYRNGVMLNYSLIAYSPWEGFRVAITGNKGRIEMKESRAPHLFDFKTGQQANPQAPSESKYELKVYPMFGQPYHVEIPKAEGGHGGGDKLLCADLFSPQSPSGPGWSRRITHRRRRIDPRRHFGQSIDRDRPAGRCG